jgi:hypothetical protein
MSFAVHLARRAQNGAKRHAPGLGAWAKPGGAPRAPDLQSHGTAEVTAEFVAPRADRPASSVLSAFDGTNTVKPGTETRSAQLPVPEEVELSPAKTLVARKLEPRTPAPDSQTPALQAPRELPSPRAFVRQAAPESESFDLAAMPAPGSTTPGQTTPAKTPAPSSAAPSSAGRRSAKILAPSAAETPGEPATGSSIRAIPPSEAARTLAPRAAASRAQERLAADHGPTDLEMPAPTANEARTTQPRAAQRAEPAQPAFAPSERRAAIRDAQAERPDPLAPPPIVEVHIGRIEIQTPPAPGPRRAAERVGSQGFEKIDAARCHVSRRWN